MSRQLSRCTNGNMHSISEYAFEPIRLLVYVTFFVECFFTVLCVPIRPVDLPYPALLSSKFRSRDQICDEWNSGPEERNDLCSK